MEALRMALVVAQGDGEDEEIEPSMQEALQAALDE
jgi:tellurite resistance protein